MLELELIESAMKLVDNTTGRVRSPSVGGGIYDGDRGALVDTKNQIIELRDQLAETYGLVSTRTQSYDEAVALRKEILLTESVIELKIKELVNEYVEVKSNADPVVNTE